MAWSRLFLAFLCVGVVFGYNDGPPNRLTTCANLMPDGTSPHRLQEGNGTYDLSVTGLSLSGSYFTYTAGQQYTGTISAGSGNAILGFLVQAWNPANERIGTFTIGTGQKHLECSSINSVPNAATLIHSQRNTNPTVTFMWTAPSGSNGLVDFRYTIVRARLMFFGPLSAASPDGIIPPAAVMQPASVTDPTRNAQDYSIIGRSPPGCTVSDCSVFVGVSVNEGNSSYLDFYLEGNAKGWVAVGFSDSPSMFSADVIACNVMETQNNMLEALDTWNPKANMRSNSRDGIPNAFLFSSASNDGRIRCVIGREAVTTGDDEFDLPLNTPLYMIYGFSDNQARGALETHGLGLRFIPEVSPSRVNPLGGTAAFSADRVRPSLTRLHGILMWVAWPVIGLTGMFFALFMRPALPNGEWFQIHRALMVMSLFVAALGFFFIFVAQFRRQPNPGLITFNTGTHIAHFVFGLITMIIHIANPLIALCRCHPGTKNRWIFNTIHGYTIGIWSVMISLTAIGLGIGIFNTEVSPLGPSFNIFWVFVAYIIIYTLLVSLCYNILFYYILPRFVYKDSNCNSGCNSGCKSKDDGKSGTEMKEKNGASADDVPVDTAGDGEKPRKPPSKDAPIRWLAFIIFAVFNVLFGITMVVLIAL